MKTIIVDTAICEKIEALQYEVESRKDIITQVLAGMVHIVGDLFDKYQAEYRKYFIAYNKAKQDMLDAYSIDNTSNWNLDFRTHELTIKE